MSRFFVEEDAVQEGIIYIVDRDDIKHISKVLRKSVGDFLDISDTKEFEYKCEIIQIDREYIKCQIHGKRHFSREPITKIVLYQGIPKQGKMESIIQKCVELGIYKIVPVFTARTVIVDKNNKIHHRVSRWQKISDEAVKQCQRGIQPKISEAIEFKTLMEELQQQIQNGTLVLFPYENETETTIKEVLKKWSAERKDASAASKVGSNYGNVSFLIGPEGGFSESEAEVLKILGAKCVTLGKTILRTETAGMAALAMIMYELEL